MLLSKEDFIILISIASGTPIILTAFVSYLLLRNNDLRKKRQIELLDAMLATQETERKRIAQDLHDQISPLLVGIKLQLSFENENLSENQIRILSNARNDLNRAIDEMRIISHDLYSSNITSIGLNESLRESIVAYDGIKKQIDFKFSIDETELSYVFKINIYRICSELIGNSIKHSNGNLIFLAITEENNIITLNFEDNGSNVNSSNENDGIGLQNIKNRVELLGGKIMDFSNTFEIGAKYKFLFKI